MTNYIKSFSLATDTMAQTLSPKGVSVAQYNQGDVNTDTLNLTVTHNNSVMDLTGATVAVVFNKPDGKVVYQDTSNGVTIIDATQGQLSISLNTQTRSAVGTVIGAVRVTYPNNQILETEKFSFNVEQSLASDQAIASVNDVSGLIGTATLTTNAKDIKGAINEVNADLADSMPAFPQRKDVVFGQEYLAYFHNKVAQQNPVNVVFSGDSTTAGYNLVDPADWTLDKAFLRQSKRNGFPNISTFNNGQSGMCTEHWNRTYVTNDINANPDLLVLRWGINDPSYDNNLNHLADNSNPTGRRTASDFKTSLYAGLQQIRNQRDYTKLSIILMTPSSTSDDTSFRNSAWHESINAIVRQAARQFNCCFIDTYRLFQDSYNANNFMDAMGSNSFFPQGHIHPLDIMNLWITDVIFNTVFSKMFIQEYSYMNKLNTLTLLNGWVNLGAGYQNAYYFKDMNGIVRCNGVIKSGVAAAIAQLPVNFRPSSNMIVSCPVYNNQSATIEIDTNGNISFQDTMPTNAPTWMSLSGIHFYAGF